MEKGFILTGRRRFSWDFAYHTLIYTFAFQKCPLYIWAIRILYSFFKEYCGVTESSQPDLVRYGAFLAVLPPGVCILILCLDVP